MTLSEKQSNWNWRQPFLTAGLVYATFIVYGSLLPFDFRPLPLGQALDRFADIRFLNLGVGARADWVANILLYVPFSFLFLASFSISTSRKTRLISIIMVSALGIGMAVAIEFLQVFFAPRTVSLNDIIAEVVGIITGIVIWCLFGHQLVDLWRRVRQGGTAGLDALFAFYLLLYLVLSLFPFDFLISQAELSAKLASPLTGWLFADVAMQRPVRSLISLIIETGLAVPLGLFLCFRRVSTGNSLWLLAFFYGGLCGIVFEGLQLFTASGVSQGVSIITRAVGAGVGMFCFRLLLKSHAAVHKKLCSSLLIFTVLPYIFLVFKMNGFFDSQWLAVSSAAGNFEGVMLLPFYYHYYTTETTAVLSLLLNMVMYLPIGCGLWAWRWCRSERTGNAYSGMTMAAPLALAVEVGKLFLVGRHPDFTNVLIASASAWVGFVLMEYLARLFSEYDFSGFREAGG